MRAREAFSIHADDTEKKPDMSRTERIRSTAPVAMRNRCGGRRIRDVQEQESKTQEKYMRKFESLVTQ